MTSTKRFKLTLAYDGTRYSGWQRQGNTGNTIQARLEALLSRTLDAPVEVHGCGRGRRGGEEGRRARARLRV